MGPSAILSVIHTVTIGTKLITIVITDMDQKTLRVNRPLI